VPHYLSKPPLAYFIPKEFMAVHFIDCLFHFNMAGICTQSTWQFQFTRLIDNDSTVDDLLLVDEEIASVTIPHVIQLIKFPDHHDLMYLMRI